MDMTSIIQSLRDRARRMTSLDTPADADLGDVALDIGAGFVPGVGTALGARDAVRGYREGDYLGMALGAAGMIPVVGGASRAVSKALRKAPQGEALDAAKVLQAQSYQSMTGPKSQMRDVIRTDADALADALRQKGFDVDVSHSGSAAGPSSYLRIYDPETGRSLTNDVRLSNHSKGAYQSQFVQDIFSKNDFQKVIDQADQMRSMGKSSGFAAMEAKAAEQSAKTADYWKSVALRANEKTKSGEALSNRERQALQWVEKNLPNREPQ